MFRPYEYWRHSYTLDTDLEIIKVQYTNPEYIKLKVNIIDRQHKYVFQSNLSVKIDKKSFGLWKRVNA